MRSISIIFNFLNSNVRYLFFFRSSESPRYVSAKRAKYLSNLRRNIFVRSIDMPVTETRPPGPFIALSAFTRPRSSQPTWRRNATRTTIISIWTPTSRCSRSSTIMQSPCSPSPRRTPAWIFTYCRYVGAHCAKADARFVQESIDIVPK